MKRRGIISSNQNILRISEPGNVPIKFNGETVGTASNIRMDGGIKADLDLDPEIKEIIDKMQQTFKPVGNPNYFNDGSQTRQESINSNILSDFEGPTTLECIAETMEELEKPRPMMKKSELFAHPEQAPEWLDDEFEVAEFIESDNIEQEKLIIMRADLPETLALLTPNLRGLGQCKRVKVIAPKGWFT